ncbi:MAG: DUF975 family protein [Agathobacter sp.]|nr:DUF975 family protein [Agathobacter sp.]
MKRKGKELKRIARGNLQGNFLELIRAFIFCNLIISLIEMPFSMMRNEVPFSTQNIIYYVAVLLITIASVVLTVGQYCLHLSIARTGKLHLSELFYPIKYDANRLIVAEAILFVVRLVALAPVAGAVAIIYFYDTTTMYLTALGLSIIGCALTVLVEMTFGLTYFVLIDNEEWTVMQALKSAIQLVKGHKRRFFYMQLSFTGMYFLTLLTLGIGILWVQPYVMQTTTLFYLDVKGELDEVLENRKKEEPTPEPVAFDSYA